MLKIELFAYSFAAAFSVALAYLIVYVAGTL